MSAVCLSDEAPESGGLCLMDARDQIPSKQSWSGETKARRHWMMLEIHWKNCSEPVGSAEGLELGSRLQIRPEGDQGATLLISFLECFLLPSMYQVGSTPREDH